MAVISKRSGASAMTPKQEEQCYCQFIEDFLNLCFMKGDSQNYPNLLLFGAFPTLMHGAFVTQPMQIKILDRVKEIVPTLGAGEDESANLKAIKVYVLTLIEG